MREIEQLHSNFVTQAGCRNFLINNCGKPVERTANTLAKLNSTARHRHVRGRDTGYRAAEKVSERVPAGVSQVLGGI